MRLIIKNKFFTLTGSSTVKDETGNLVYKVKGNWFANVFAKTYKKVVKNKEGKKEFVIKNKFFHAPGFPNAKILRDGKQIAVVTPSHLVKAGYEVTGATDPIRIVGERGKGIFNWKLDIFLGDKMIGAILPYDKVHWSDTYVLECDDPEDASFLVAVIIAIDNISDKKRRNGNGH